MHNHIVGNNDFVAIELLKKTFVDLYFKR